MSLNLKPGIGERGQRTFNFPITARADSGLGPVVAGRTTIDASRFKAVSGVMKAQAQVSDGALSGVIELYDVTAGDTLVDSLAITSDQPTDVEFVLSLDFSIPRVLEVRAGLDSPGPYLSTEVLIIWYASVELTTVF